jgi:hypothetical protein
MRAEPHPNTRVHVWMGMDHVLRLFPACAYTATSHERQEFFIIFRLSLAFKRGESSILHRQIESSGRCVGVSKVERLGMDHR